MSDAENVWTCLCLYNTNAAQGLVRLGYSRRTAVKMLETYKKRSEYHGHCSGGAGDGVHQGAADNRTAAIAYLEGRAGELATLAEAKKVPDRQKEATNREQLRRLSDILENNKSNLGTASTMLDLIDPEWRDRGSLAADYKRLREAKKSHA